MPAAPAPRQAPARRAARPLVRLAARAAALLLACGASAAPAWARQAAPDSALEREVLAELNRARTDPQGFADRLERTLAHYRGTDYHRPGDRVIIVTTEGPAAVLEAIRVLRASAPLPALGASRGLSLAALDHVRDQGPKGVVGHAGSDGSRAPQRADRHGRWNELISENIEYGSGTAFEVVANLIVDDGVPSRGHRHNIFSAGIRVAGVGCGAHATYRRMCVVVHAAEYAEASADARVATR